jgi:hypothetical protein
MWSDKASSLHRWEVWTALHLSGPPPLDRGADKMLVDCISGALMGALFYRNSLETSQVSLLAQCVSTLSSKSYRPLFRV